MTGSDRAQIAAGQFWTAAELRAVPSRRRAAQPAATAAADPNTAPASAQARAAAASPGVCAWCYEPGDARSALELQPAGDYRHPECAAGRGYSAAVLAR
jgi:hypothetical protein